MLTAGEHRVKNRHDTDVCDPVHSVLRKGICHHKKSAQHYYLKSGESATSKGEYNLLLASFITFLALVILVCWNLLLMFVIIRAYSSVQYVF